MLGLLALDKQCAMVRAMSTRAPAPEQSDDSVYLDQPRPASPPQRCLAGSSNVLGQRSAAFSWHHEVV